MIDHAKPLTFQTNPNGADKPSRFRELFWGKSTVKNQHFAGPAIESGLKETDQGDGHKVWHYCCKPVDHIFR